MSAQAANPTASAVATAGHGRNWGLISLVVGVIFLAISAVGLFMGVSDGNPRPFLGYLIGAAFWLSLLIGALLLLMISYLLNAGWMTILRRQLEHAVSGFKWMALIFLPLILLGLFAGGEGIPWVWLDVTRLIPGGETVAHDPLYVHKAGYLNGPFFAVRYVLYFVIWAGLAYMLRRHSFAMDTDGDVRHYRAAYRWSAFGVFATAAALTFGAFDWFKSLEYHWFSTMFGVWFFAACVRSATAALIIVGFILGAKGYLRGIYQDRPGHGAHSYLLGCLLLAFTVFWAYISFSQYFLQYNANIPEETFWYNMREFKDLNGQLVKNSWWPVSMFLIFGYFLAPFLSLLWFKNKFGLRIVAIAAWTLVFHLLDLYWNILPQKLYDAEHGYIVRQFGISLWDVTALIGIGGICIWAFFNSAAKERPIPIRDPRIKESVEAHG